jgi:hypothetical protein
LGSRDADCRCGAVPPALQAALPCLVPACLT